ncbi:MAG: sigma-70 family RNA polymerase sigma factor [Verrucomicrobiota bacterium]
MSVPKNAADRELPRNFHTTRWSLVGRVGDQETSAAALESLCAAYWNPLHAYVCRRGYGIEEARDLTQSFFATLLSKDLFSQADPERGKLRTFLLGALNHFLINDWDKNRALKRGGGCEVVSLDACDSEDRPLHEPADELSPEKLFDRRWAETLLELVFARMRREYEAVGQSERFELCKAWLAGNDGTTSYTEVAVRLGIAETGVRTLVHRLRRRFRELMRAEIAETVNTPADVDEEIRALFHALSG